MSITREFKGFQVSDDFVLTLNSREGSKEVNLQELMASRLHYSTDETVIDWYDSSGLKDTDICKVHNISYNHIRDCREHTDWNKALDAFSDANSKITAQDLKRLAGKGSRASKGDNNGIKFTTTHAKNLGMAIFNNLPTELRVHISNYDSTNESAFGANTKNGKLVEKSIDAFCYELRNGSVKAKQDAELTAQAAQYQKEVDAKKAQESKALAFLKTMGFAEPTKEQINSCIAMMA